MHTAERVARVIVNLARVPRREVAVGTMAKFLIVQSHLAPGLTERQMGRRVHRKHFIDEPAAASRVWWRRRSGSCQTVIACMSTRQ